jgi:hypothetical protein
MGSDRLRKLAISVVDDADTKASAEAKAASNAKAEKTRRKTEWEQLKKIGKKPLP